jgi:hypothetical protein
VAIKHLPVLDHFGYENYQIIVYLFISLFACVFTSVYLYLSACVYPYPSIFIYLSLSEYIFFCICLSSTCPVFARHTVTFSFAQITRTDGCSVVSWGVRTPRGHSHTLRLSGSTHNAVGQYAAIKWHQTHGIKSYRAAHRVRMLEIEA